MNPTDTPDVHEDADLILRHISRQFPIDFAAALLPPGTLVTSAEWLDTQVTSRQRRLDRALNVQVNGERRLEHTEWVLTWKKNLPYRIHEYHNLMVTALVNEQKAKKRANKERRRR